MHYQVGGSLTTQAPSYIERRADKEFLAAIGRGEFCYVLNSRQMGKSSLMVRSHQALQAQGYRCAVLDMTNIGSENITPLQWYKGIVKNLWRSFKLKHQTDVNFKDWWQDETDISLLQRLSQFIKDILLTSYPDEELIIFIDEIDSILSLPFSVDDFFALVRFCYNQRAVDTDYNRIHFAIFGVATPADLIRDRTRTPFNIGTRIILNGFTSAEAAPLAAGLTVRSGSAMAVLKAIVDWTGGQPFLTQKLCKLAISSSEGAIATPLTIPPGNEAYWVENLVQQRILHRWESQDEPEHLRTIRNRILSNQDTAGRLLSTYQKVLSETVTADDSRDQIELVLSGLVQKVDGCLQVKNRIYAEIFNHDWVKHQLDQLRPYAQQFDAWLASAQTDDSRLLRGQALQDAQHWSQGKRLSDADYRYLAASAEGDAQAVQQALEAQRTKAVEAELRQTKKVRRQQWLLIGVISAALAVTAVLGVSARRSEQRSRVSEIKALISSSKGNYNSDQRLNAVVDAIKANWAIAQLSSITPQLEQAAKAALQESIYTVQEYNQLHLDTSIDSVVFSADGTRFAAAGNNGKIYLFRADGSLEKEIDAHRAVVRKVVFSPDGQRIASSSADKTVKIWRLDGILVRAIEGFPADVEQVDFSPDGRYLALSAPEIDTELWRVDGEKVTTIEGHLSFSFSPNGQQIATVSSELATASIWQLPPALKATELATAATELTLIRSFETGLRKENRENKPNLRRPRLSAAIAFSPDSEKIAIAIPEKPIFLWPIAGGNPTIIPHAFANRTNLAFTPDGDQIAAVANNQQVNLWQLNGTLTQTIKGAQSSISSIAFAPAQAGKPPSLATSSSDGKIRLWAYQQPFFQSLSAEENRFVSAAISPDGKTVVASQPNGDTFFWRRENKALFPTLPQSSSADAHSLAVHEIDFSADSQQLVSGGRSGKINLWDTKGQVKTTLGIGHNIWGLALSSDTHQLAAALGNGDIALWQRTEANQFPTLPRILKGHTSAVRRVAFSPDGKQLLSASLDGTLKLWQPEKSSQPLATLSAHEASVHGGTFSPDGEIIASASSDGTLGLWQTDGRLIKRFKGHRGEIMRIVFSADGKYLFSAAKDGLAKVWSREGDLLKILSNDDVQLREISVSDDGERLLTTGRGGNIRLWQVGKITRLDDMAYACEWVKDYLATLEDEGDRQLCQTK